MKYIVIKRGDEEYMIMFPNSTKMSHKRMAEVVEGIRVDLGYHGWQRDFIGCPVVAAGFVTASGHCHGYSESLGIGSRPEDSELLKSQYA